MFKWRIEQKLDHVNPRPLNWPKSSLGQRKSPFIYKDYAILITPWNSLSQASTSCARTPSIFWLSSVWIDVLLRGRMEKTGEDKRSPLCLILHCLCTVCNKRDMSREIWIKKCQSGFFKHLLYYFRMVFMPEQCVHRPDHHCKGRH